MPAHRTRPGQLALDFMLEERPYTTVGENLVIDSHIQALAASHAPFAFSVSGGKDGSAAAASTNAWLDSIGHAGPRVLIHSDLGSVEWAYSQDICVQLAERLNLPLITVSRAAGGMMDRWQSRWLGNVRRYANLETVKLILPWSTSAMRFCTSELKTAVIGRALSQRWPGREIVSVLGLRREESANRAKKPVSKADPALSSVERKTSGRSWNPILDWFESDVWEAHERYNLPIHPAYRLFKTTRVSCAFCILGSQGDLFKASTDPMNAPTYRDQADLELTSTFSFQSDHWLADLAPQLLSETQRAHIPRAKAAAGRRVTAEAEIPKHLLYTKGWPTCIPTWGEAEQLASIRREVADAVGLTIRYDTAETIVARFEALLKQKGTPGATDLIGL